MQCYECYVYGLKVEKVSIFENLKFCLFFVFFVIWESGNFKRRLERICSRLGIASLGSIFIMAFTVFTNITDCTDKRLKFLRFRVLEISVVSSL